MGTLDHVEIPLSRVGGERLEPVQIGVNQPLAVRLLTVHPGPDRHRQLLVTSAVKPPSVYTAGARAVHYVYDNIPGRRTVDPTADADGTDVVYYSPAMVDGSLLLTVRFAYDDFDLEKYKRWLHTARGVSELPMFALATTLGGAAGVAGGQAIMYAAGKTLELALGALDDRADADNDWVGTWRLNLDRFDAPLSSAGYVVVLADGSESTEVLSPSAEGGWNDQVIVQLNDAYSLDPSNRLLYANTNEPVHEHAYAVLSVNGAPEPALEKWTATAVSAAIAAKFFNPVGDRVSDVGELLGAFNDVVFARKVGQLGVQIAAADEAMKEKLVAQRDASLKNIQDAELRKQIEAAVSDA